MERDFWIERTETRKRKKYSIKSLSKEHELSKLENVAPFVKEAYKDNRAFEKDKTRECGTFLITYRNKTIGSFSISLKNFSITIKEEPKIYSCLHLDLLAIEKNYQRLGIGQTILKIIMNECENLCNHLHCVRGITLNPVATSLKFYEKYKFIPITINDELNIPGSVGADDYFWIDFIKESDKNEKN